MLKERDKFQSVVLKISEFGLVQMTRKRSGKTLIQELTESCPTCQGLGYIKTIQTICFNILPNIKQALYANKGHNMLTIAVHPRVFDYITNHEYNSIFYFEKNFGFKLVLESSDEIPLDEFKIVQ